MASSEPRITHDNGAIVTFSDGAVHDRVNYETLHPGDRRPTSSRSGGDKYVTMAYRNTWPTPGGQHSSTTNGGAGAEHPAYQRGLQSAQDHAQSRRQ